MLDGPKVSGLERWASIQRAGEGMDTTSVWGLAVVVVRGDDQQGSSQPAEYWELGGQGMPGAQELELLASGDSATAESQGPDM